MYKRQVSTQLDGGKPACFLSGGTDSSTVAGMAALASGKTCLLYTSDAADDLLCVDLGGRRIIKKKIHMTTNH